MSSGWWVANLLHAAFSFFAHGIFLHAEPRLYSLSQLAVSVFALLATPGAASLSWRFFEKPLIRRGHRYTYGESPTKSTPAGFVMTPLRCNSECCDGGRRSPMIVGRRAQILTLAKNRVVQFLLVERFARGHSRSEQ